MKQNKIRCLNRDVIKYIAMFTMLLNHIAAVFLEPQTPVCKILTDIGYFTAITMCYFLVEGYDHTRSKKKYAMRLFWFAVISEIPFCLAFTEDGILSFCGFNMIFTLLVCFMIVHVMHQMDHTFYRSFAVACLVLATGYSDWGILAPVFTVLFVKAKGSEEKERAAWCISAVLFFIFNLLGGEGLPGSLGAAMGIVCAGICVNLFYNGKRMEKWRSFSKWFFYLFYPVHLLVLGLIRIKITG